jgi:hypothetical protein
MNQTTDSLAQRLRELPLDHPRPELIASRVLGAAARPSPSRLLPRLAVAAAIVLAALPVAWGVLYMSPATAAALADASGPGGFSSEILDHVGLGTGSSITAQGSSATSSSYRVQMVGAYADSIRTVILLKMSPAALASSDVRLTDQFGFTYNLTEGEGNLMTGDQALTFQPASPIASVTGMRFTVTFNQASLLSGETVSGAWTVQGVVLLKSGTRLATPASGTLGSGTVTFTEVRYSGRVVSIRAEVRGLSLEGFTQEVTPDSKGHPRFSIELAPIDGGAAGPVNSLGLSSSGDVTEVEALALNIDPGTYLLTLSLEGVGQLQRRLVVG